MKEKIRRKERKDQKKIRKGKITLFVVGTVFGDLGGSIVGMPCFFQYAVRLGSPKSKLRGWVAC